jgi:hypothetical protein
MASIEASTMHPFTAHDQAVMAEMRAIGSRLTFNELLQSATGKSLHARISKRT